MMLISKMPTRKGSGAKQNVAVAVISLGFGLRYLLLSRPTKNKVLSMSEGGEQR